LNNNPILQSESLVNSIEEAAAYVRKVGILPLSGFIPEHPSMESVTEKTHWYTGLMNDPWLWRARLASSGAAAYGRFFAKKPSLISAELFPLLKNVLYPGESVKERYAAGLVPKACVELYEAIRSEEGIDAKLLRSTAKMKDKEQKPAFDNGLIELQSRGEIVIAGVAERWNEEGAKVGWNSTSYMTAAHWMEIHGIEESVLSGQAAEDELKSRLEGTLLSKPAFKFVVKALGL
jgi:hypothetical protein